MQLNVNLDKVSQKSPEMEKVSSSLSMVRNVVLNYIIPLVCVVSAVLVGLLYVYPKYKALPELNAQIEGKTALASSLDAKLLNLKNIIDFKEVITENSALVDDVLPSEAKVPQLLTQIDTMAKESGLEVTRLSYSYQGDTGTTTGGEKAVVSDVSQKYITINLSVEGTYSQIQAFMSLLETSARLVQVDDFRYSVSSKTDSASKLTVTVNLSAPYLYVVSTAVTDEPIDLDIKGKDFNDFITKLKQLRFYRIGIDQVIEIPVATESTPSAVAN